MICWTLTSAQDTIMVHQIVDTTGTRQGEFFIEGHTSTNFRDGRWVLEKSPSYQIGNYNNGLRHGQWKIYKRGESVDTLLWQGTFRHDTIQSDTSYYHNGNVKQTKRYVNRKLVNQMLFFETGQKRHETACIDCIVPYSRSDELVIEHYKNGVLKSLGRYQRFTKRKKGKEFIGYGRRKGTWYHYTDKGEIYKIETYWRGMLLKKRTFDVEGQYYEWYLEAE